MDVYIAGQDINKEKGYLLIVTEGIHIKVQKVNGLNEPIEYKRSNQVNSTDLLFLISEGKGIEKYSLSSPLTNSVVTVESAFITTSSEIKIEFIDYQKLNAPFFTTEADLISALNHLFDDYHSSFRFTSDPQDPINTIRVDTDAGDNSTFNSYPYYDVNTKPEIYSNAPLILVHEIIHSLLLKKGFGIYGHHMPVGIMHGSDHGLSIDLRTLLGLHTFSGDLPLMKQPATLDVAANQLLPTKFQLNSLMGFAGCSMSTPLFSFSSFPTDFNGLNDMFILEDPNLLLSEIIFIRKKKQLKKYSVYIKNKKKLEWDYFNDIPNIEQLGIERESYAANSRNFHLNQRLNNTVLALSYLNTKYQFDERFIIRLNKYVNSQDIGPLPELEIGHGGVENKKGSIKKNK